MPPIGRASAAIAPIDARGDFGVVQQLTFARGAAAFLDLTSKPVIMSHRACEEIKGDLIDRAS